MTLRKYATAIVLGHELQPMTGGPRLIKSAHRASFDYEPRPGFLYVRSRIISSRCNDNHDEFPAEEIRQGYKSLIGKPVFVNHNNNDHKVMRGVIIDAVLHEDTAPDGRPDTWVEGLHELDAQRFPKLAAAIVSGRINRTSMGTDVGFSVCSACNNKASTPAEYCQHIPRMKGQILYKHAASGQREGEVIREICHKLSFFENSFLVEPPADPTAYVLGVDTRGLNKAASLQKEAIPEGMRFHFTPADVHPTREHYMRATMPNASGEHKEVGHLQWSPDHGMVTMVSTDRDLRHQGVGTALWQRAHEMANERGLTPPKHSDVRTPDGYGWSKNVDKQSLPLPAPGQQSLFGRDLAEATDTSLQGPKHDDLFDHVMHDHGGYSQSSVEMARDRGTLDKIHEAQHKYGNFRQMHVHGSLRKEARPDWMPEQGQNYHGTHCLICGEQAKYYVKPSQGQHGGKWFHHDSMKRDHLALPADPDSVINGIPAADAQRDQAKAQMEQNLDRMGLPSLRKQRELRQMPPDPFKTGSLHQGEPFRIQSKNGKWLVVDIKGKTRGEHATEQDARVHQATLYSSLPQAGDVSGNQNPKSTPDTATEIVRARMAKKKLKTLAELSDDDIFKGLDMPTADQGHKDIVHEKAKGLADSLMAPFYEQHGGEEGYHTHLDNQSMLHLQDRYRGGTGKFAFDEADEGERAEPYYEIKHTTPQGRHTGWSIRHYADGPMAEIHHEATPGEAHDVVDIGRPIGSDHNPFGRHQPPDHYGHNELAADLHAWVNDSETGSRDHLEGQYGDPRIRRHKQRYPQGKMPPRQSHLVEAAAHKYPNPADHPFFKKYPVSTENVVASFKKADKGRKAQGMRWYSDAHLLAKALTPEDPGKAAGVLAAYSPKAAWPDNMFNAARSLHEGRALGLGEGASIMGQHQRTAQKIMDGEHHSKVMKSPKIGDFAHLIEHGGDSEDEKEIGKTRVVVDRHAMSVATGKRMTTKDLDEAPLHSRHYYEHVADTYRQAATQLSQELGEKIAPHQVQAVTWGVQQAQNQKDDEESGAGGAKGRFTRTKNSWNNWAEHAKGQHPDLHGDPPNLHAKNPYEARRRVQSSLPGFLAYGETRAPAEVDTLRTESCPVCGETDSFDGDRCEVCHFLQPPSMFTDPDTGVAKQMDLKKEPFDQGMVGPNGEPLPDVDTQEEQQEMAGMPGTPDDQVADLFCPACGFSADTQAPMTNNDPSMPSGQQGLMEGDVCPECGQATMLSPNDVGEMGGEVPQEIAGDSDADGVPDDQEADEDQDGVPDDGEPDVDADGVPDDAEPDDDGDGVPDDAEGEGPPAPGGTEGPEEQDESEESADDPVEDDEKAPKGRKDNSRRASWRGHERDTMTKPNQTAGASSELAILRRTVAIQQEQLAVAGRQLHYLAQLAGVAGEFDAIKRQGAQKIADIMNPAQPIPDPAGGAPTETTQQAEAPETFDDPRNPGLTPGSTNGVPAQMTDSPLNPGVTLPTSPYTQLVDPTQPVAGTETHVPLDQTKIETDVHIGDPMVNKDNPAGYGFPLTGPFAADGAASANTTTSPGMQRTMASIRLAKLRKSAGLVTADTDELLLGSQIERTAALTDAMIMHEIGTLDSVVKAASRVPAGRRQQGGPLPKTAGAERRVPSLAGGMDLSTQASVGSGFDADDASDLFVDSLS